MWHHWHHSTWFLYCDVTMSNNPFLWCLGVYNLCTSHRVCYSCFKTALHTLPLHCDITFTIIAAQLLCFVRYPCAVSSISLLVLGKDITVYFYCKIIVFIIPGTVTSLCLLSLYCDFTTMFMPMLGYHCVQHVDICNMNLIPTSGSRWKKTQFN